MKLSKLLIIFFILTCLVISLASCNQTTDPSDTDATDSTEGATEKSTIDPALMEGKFPIFVEGSYVCDVVSPENGTPLEKEMYKRIRERFKVLTGVLPPMKTDFLAYNDTGESRSEPAVLIGMTNYEESKQVYEDLAYGEAKIQMVGNKLVIAFSSEIDAEYIFLKLLGLTNRGSSDFFGIDENANETSVSNENLALIPRYPFSNLDIVNGEKDSFLLSTDDSSLEDFDAYCEIVKNSGYELKDRKVIGDNVFATFFGETNYIYTYYTEHNETIKIAGAPLSTYADPDQSSGLEETYTPYIASIIQPHNGQGYIFRLPDGRFLIHDGGYGGSDRVYSALRKLESGPITIAAWFISHPHGDHYPALEVFLSNHANDEDITIEMVAFNYAGAEVYDLSDSAGKENMSNAARDLYNMLEKYIPDVPVVKLHTGQTLNFGSASVEVIYTVEDILPRILPNVNDSSLVLRFNFGGQTLMMLADTCYDSAPIICELWGDYLKSDIVQMAHHGIWPAQEDIYHLIQGETVLFPAKHANMKNDLFDSRWGATTQAALKYAKDIFISGDGVQVIELPHVIENNKEATMEYVKNYQDK